MKSLQDSMVMLKECKTRQWQNKLQQLVEGTKTRTHIIWREEDLSIMGIKNRCTMARDCQSGMEENCIGSQGPHQAVVLEKKTKKIKRKSKEPETNVTKMQKAIIT